MYLQNDSKEPKEPKYKRYWIMNGDRVIFANQTIWLRILSVPGAWLYHFAEAYLKIGQSITVLKFSCTCTSCSLECL